MSTKQSVSSGQEAEKTGAAVMVDAAVRVIAAGIFEHADGKKYARATLALTPIACSDKPLSDEAADEQKWPGAVDLAKWPEKIDELIGSGVKVDIWNVTETAGRGVANPAPSPNPLVMSPIKRLGGSDKRALNQYWSDVMGGEKALKLLARAFASRPGTLEEVLRRPADGGAQRTPDIHGTDRSPAAVALVLERAYQIINRLAGRNDATRPPPRDTIEDRVWARVWSDSSASGSIPVTDAERDAAHQKMREEAEVEEIAAALASSAARADAAATSRRDYLGAKSAADAITALTRGPDMHCYRVPPEACARTLIINPAAGPSIDAAHAAYRGSSQPGAPGSTAPRLPADVDGNLDPELEFARRRFYSLQAYPSLARLFRFVVDVECELSQLEASVAGPTKQEGDVLDHDAQRLGDKKPLPPLPDANTDAARFTFLSAVIQGDDVLKRVPRVWTSAKVRLPITGNKESGAGHFYPCTREEMDARAAGKTDEQLRQMAIAEQIDGMVHLGQSATCAGAREPRFDIVTLDSITSIAGDQNFERSRSLRAAAIAKHKDELPPELLAEQATQDRGTLRTGGLALVDRWRQNHAIARHIASMRQHEAIGDSTKPYLLLDASDVTIGYKLDVGVKSKFDDSTARRRWHTLMRRKVRYEPFKPWPISGRTLDATIQELYPDPLSRARADDGLLTVPAALRSWAAGPRPSGAANTTAFTEEIVGSWRGDPLGLSCDTLTYNLASHDLGVNIHFDLPTRFESESFTPPPLRFGWRYHFGLRAVYAGGVSVPLERALGHFERSHGRTLALPPVTEPGRIFRRHERIDGPVVTVPEWALGRPTKEGQPGPAGSVKLPGRESAEQTTRMIVRTISDAENRKLLETGDNGGQVNGDAASHPRLARRILIPPAVALDFAGLHGALNGAKTERVELFEPRVMQEKERPAQDECAVDDWAVKVRTDDNKSSAHVWQKVKVAWRRIEVRNRPAGGLKGVDYRAAWGGFPVFRMQSPKAAASVPMDGEAVALSAGEVTDFGEIVDRGARQELRYKLNNVETTRQVEWSPTAGVPSGAAVFRPLSSERKGATERQPYYPDPAALHLVVDVQVRGGTSRQVVVPLYRDEEAKPTPTGYPDVIPVVLDVVHRKNSLPELLKVASGLRSYSNLRELTLYKASLEKNPKDIVVRHVTVALAPGEEATIRTWCLPSEFFLKYMFEGTESAAALCVACGCVSPSGLTKAAEVDAACRTGFDLLTGGQQLSSGNGASATCTQGVGGLRLPTQSQVDALADRIREFMKTRPLTEIAAATELEAVHAVDQPVQSPAFVLGGAEQGLPSLNLIRAANEAVADIMGKSAPAGPNAELYNPDNWTLQNQRSDAIGVIVSGTVAVHAPSTGAVEIHATGAAAARGRFDDQQRGRSPDDQARGLWPKADGETDIPPQTLFGFFVAPDGRVALAKEKVTLLRVEGFGPNEDLLDLLDAQRRAADTSTAGSLRAVRPASFPDARARYVELSTVAVARHGAILRTRYDELLPNLTKSAVPDSKGDKRTSCTWLPATVRPARIAPLSLIPSFVWVDPVCAKGEIGIERRMCVRVRMRRPWFSSGEGERIGVVLWPPHLFNLKPEDIQQDALLELTPGRGRILLKDLPPDGSGLDGVQDLDLGPGGAWVTRWGADPIRPGAPLRGWLLSADNFKGFKNGQSRDFLKAIRVTDAAWDAPPDQAPPDGAVVAHALMPLPANADAAESRAADPAGGFMSVALATYEARFDPEQEHWYADVYIDPLAATYPFVRLGLVRYQPHAPAQLRVSEPIVEWVQIMPMRSVTASLAFDEKTNKAEITVTASGAAQERGDDKLERSSAQRPVMRMSLLRGIIDGDENPGEWVFETQEKAATSGVGNLQWTTTFSIPKAEFIRSENSWSVYVEEVEKMRPATYQDEPRPATADDTMLTETGPRFAAKLDLSALKT